MERTRNLYREVSGGKPGKLIFNVTDLDGSRKQFVRQFLPHQRLILLGGGHIALELCRLASELDFEVAVADDRQEFASGERFPRASRVLCGNFEETIEKLEITSCDFVTVMTRGHLADGVCLRKVLQGTMPRYLGMVGSRRKTALLKSALLEEGFSPEQLDQIYAPIGLEIGARTPAEIAISILAQLIQARSGQMEKEEGLLDYCNSDMDLLKFMAETTSPYVLAVVMEKCGSAPVAGGAVMAVTRAGIAAGTVGGGRGEFEVIREAVRLLETGESRMVEVNMTGQEAAGHDMICGGTLKVWLEYCGGQTDEEKCGYQ